MDQTGLNARSCNLSFLPAFRPVPAKGSGSNASNDIWPSAICNIAKARTLPELIEDAKEFLNADGGRSIKLYVGLKLYKPTGQMVAFVAERQNDDGSIKLIDAVSFGLKPLGQSTVALLRQHGATGLRGVGFGAPPCSVLQLPDYQLKLSSAALFSGAAIPDDFPDTLDIDLYLVQRNITAQVPEDVLHVENVLMPASMVRYAERQKPFIEARRKEEEARRSNVRTRQEANTGRSVRTRRSGPE